MAAQPVEWVLVVFYGPEAHHETYGRQVKQGGYSKDFIQLPGRKEFLDEAASVFGVDRATTKSVPLTYQWARGMTTGHFVFKSADRAHLKWETRLRTPPVWKMSLTPSEFTDETIPGDPTHRKFDDAEAELAMLATRGAGQPYLMAIKLLGEPRTLHLRAYLSKPSKKYAWADIRLAPKEIQDLAGRTSQGSAKAWSRFASGGVSPGAKVEGTVSRLVKVSDPVAVFDLLDYDTGRATANYLRNPGHGLFFDPTRNHDAWDQPEPLPQEAVASIDEWLHELDTRFPADPEGDVEAEKLGIDPNVVESFKDQIKQKSFGVPDTTGTVKIRGSAQKAFADAVKANYGNRCSITGIATKSFLIAAHIVPWSEDQDIRLDPSNGICLSLLVDKAFENGCLEIEDDLTIRIARGKVGSDSELLRQLVPYDGKKLTPPSKERPKAEYLRRRRALTASKK